MTTPELPPLPPLGRFSQDFHRMRVMQDGAWCPYDDVKAIDDAREARERILVAEIKQLRNLWIAAEERAAYAEQAALSHADIIVKLRAECEAMRADAERYRSLRRGRHAWLVVSSHDQSVEYADEELDAAIDAARGAP